ncbi:MAG: hypothetical protein GF416_03555 [Candidatus Altiarchaeales archaeon]|nr:hypothetical protein [Candidatus Altiarchaeales archaeon]MBD3416195.1 hypothetical protein [Candidatus Altiarchaeales archaeon]
MSLLSFAVLFIGLLLGLLGLGGGAYFVYNHTSKKPVESVLMELAGELKINFYPETEGKPAFASGTYSGRGLTLDLLNEKGYVDKWHPHSRIVVSVDRSVRDTHIIAVRGRFFSRKLGEVDVDHPRFGDRYVFLSSSPKKGEKVVTKDVANWVIALDMPFTLSDGHIVYHQEKVFEDKKRVKHIVDAMVYIANMAERVR